MAIYALNGEEIGAAYDVNGETLAAAYDLDGLQILNGDYSIANVVSYFRESTQDLADTITELPEAWESFIFVTDTHGNGNKQHSQAIALYLLDNTPASMIVLGGDYSSENWSRSEYETYRAPYLNRAFLPMIYALFGNHETKGNGTVEAKQCIYNDFLKDKSGLTGALTDNYYYFDDAGRKVRYVFLNTSDGGSQYEMSAAQISWISQAVQLPGTDWQLIVFGHVTLNNMGIPTYSNESNGAAVVNAIKQCNGTIIGYFCGHQHIDALHHDGNFEHVTLQCDKFENVNYYDGVSVTDRVEGTTTEQAVSVISFNTQTRQVVIRRIGAGRQRSMSYSY